MFKMDSPLASAEATTILALNDDCFLEVFSYLDLLDMEVVAKVCSRFRQNAVTCFEYSKKKSLNLRKEIASAGDSVEDSVFKISGIFRNFGCFLAQVNEDDMCGKQNHWSEEAQSTCRRSIMELVVEYCSGTLVEFEIHGIDVKDESVAALQPLFENLQKLKLIDIRIGETFLDMLPVWSPELRELELSLRPNHNVIVEGRALQFDGLFQPFEKLVNISLKNIENLENSDIDEMLKRNPQLTGIELRRCRRLDNQIFRSIAIHASNVETLAFKDVLFGEGDAECFGQLRKLKSLDLDFVTKPPVHHILPVIHQIGVLDIPLKSLYLRRIGYDNTRYYEQFETTLSSLKNLEKLALHNISNVWHISIGCFSRAAPQIRVFDVTFDELEASARVVWKMIASSPALDVLIIRASEMDGPAGLLERSDYRCYERFVKRRREKRNLRIHLSSRNFHTNMLPSTAKECKRPFSLFIDSTEYSDDT